MEKRGYGGIRLELRKAPACTLPIEPLPAPHTLFLPFKQYAGTPLVPAVLKGQAVLRGQPLGRLPETGNACMLHAPASGIVTDILPANGDTPPTAVLESDGEDTPFASVAAEHTAPPDAHEIIAMAREAGIVCTGDGNTPLWYALESLRAQSSTSIVLHAVEDEPFLCGAYRLLCEDSGGVARGLALVLRCAGKTDALLAVGEDVPAEAVDSMCQKAGILGTVVCPVRVPTQYPVAQARYLARLLSGGKNVRPFFLRPEDCLHLARAADGIVQTTRIVTVAGDAVKHPRNLWVRIGSPLRFLLEHCGLSQDSIRIVLNSPMRGRIALPDEPVTKQTGAVLAFPEKAETQSVCIRCGRCARVCPEKLLPLYIARFAAHGDFEACSDLQADCCSECGCCAYICPGRVPLLKWLTHAKTVGSSNRKERVDHAADQSPASASR